MAKLSAKELRIRNQEIIALANEGASISELSHKYNIAPGWVRKVLVNEGICVERWQPPSEPKNVVGDTIESLRKKYPYKVGDILQVKNESGKYIKATVKQVTEWQIFASGVDGYTHAISFQSLANEPNQIKGAKM